MTYVMDQLQHLLAIPIGSQNVGVLVGFVGIAAGAFILGCFHECWFRDRATRRLEAEKKQARQIWMRLTAAERW